MTFESVHEQGARTLAQEAAAAGVARLVLGSGISADPQSGSPYIRARGRGELVAIIASQEHRLACPRMGRYWPYADARG